MAVTPIQSRTAHGTGNTLSVSFAALPTVGNFITVEVCTSGETIGTPSVTDNQGNTYVQDVASDGSSTGVAIHRCQAIATSAGTFTVTEDPTGSSSSIAIAITEWPASFQASPVDTTAVKTEGASSTPTTGNLVTSTQTTIIGVVTHSSGATAMTPGGTYTQLIEDENTTDMPINTEYKSVASGTYTANWTLGASVTCIACAVAYKETGGGGGSSPTYPELERFVRGVGRGLLSVAA